MPGNFSTTYATNEEEACGSDDEETSVPIARLRRPSVIKVIEFMDPDTLTCGRLSLFNDVQLHQMLFLIAPTHYLSNKPVDGVRTMGSLKHMLKSISMDNGHFHNIDTVQFSNLIELAVSVGWTEVHTKSVSRLMRRKRKPSSTSSDARVDRQEVAQAVHHQEPEARQFQDIRKWVVKRRYVKKQPQRIDEAVGTAQLDAH